MYCEKCCMIVEEGRSCPVCRSRRVRKPRADDGCFLIELESLWGGMLEDVLKQNRIPCYYRNMLGAGITATLGIGVEHIRFYVPYDRLDEARDIVAGLFQEEITE